MPPKRRTAKKASKSSSRSSSRSSSKSSPVDAFRPLPSSRDPFNADEIERLNNKLAELRASDNKEAATKLKKLYKEFNAAKKNLNRLRESGADDEVFSLEYKRTEQLRKEFGNATIGEEAVRAHEERTNAAAEAQTEAADRDFNEWVEEYRAQVHHAALDPLTLFDNSVIVASERDGTESDCPICMAHLSHTEEAGDVYAIDTETGKKSKKVNTPIKCGHKFHKNCIHAWVNNVAKCPLCKGVIKKIRRANDEPMGKGGKRKTMKRY